MKYHVAVILFILDVLTAFRCSVHPIRLNGIRDRVQISKLLASSTNELALQESQYKLYDGEKINKYYSKHPIQAWERLIEIGTPILYWWITQKLDAITSRFRSEEENKEYVLARARGLRDAIVESKSVTLIKSGQALALRPDIIKSPEYIAQLQTLQDEVGTFDNDVAMRMISEELGRDAHEIFTFNPVLPIASASIGQVYKATLRQNNASVAVKVQRPDAIEKVGVDMYLLRVLAALIKRRYKLKSDLVGVADEFGSQLYKELNYQQEAANCQKFKSLYGAIPGIYVPDVYTQLTSRRILTMEFVEGTKGPWAAGGEQMLIAGLQCSVLQLLGTGFFHSDPHRGNLLQTPDGKLAYLDFGMKAEGVNKGCVQPQEDTENPAYSRTYNGLPAVQIGLCYLFICF